MTTIREKKKEILLLYRTIDPFSFFDKTYFYNHRTPIQNHILPQYTILIDHRNPHISSDFYFKFFLFYFSFFSSPSTLCVIIHQTQKRKKIFPISGVLQCDPIAPYFFKNTLKLHQERKNSDSH